MIFSEYVPLAMRTNNPQLSVRENWIHAGLGVSTEILELLSGLVLENADLDSTRFKELYPKLFDYAVKELGDIAWYIALVVKLLGVPASRFEVSADLVDTVSPHDALTSLVKAGQDISTRVKWEICQGHKNELTYENLVDSLIEVLQSVWVVAAAVGSSFSNVLEENVEKLRRRYPRGFDAKSSQERTE